MNNSRAARAQDLAEWFRAEADNGTNGEADLMARAARALERIAAQRDLSPAIANDNSTSASRRARR
jgi:hypothetical protein